MTAPGFSMAAFLDAMGVRAKPGHGWVSVECPWHDDTTASASFNEGLGLFRCHACDMKGDVLTLARDIYDEADLEEVLANIPGPQVAAEASPERAPRSGSSASRSLLREAAERYHAALIEGDSNPAKEYLQDRGFTLDMVTDQMLGWVREPVTGHEQYAGRLAIPYLTTSGVVDMRFRCLKQHDHKRDKCPKYLSLPHHQARMYDARRVMDGGPVIAVTEGELDAIVMTHLIGIPAVGIPGATSWSPHFSLVLSGFDTVLVIGDGDEAGRAFSRKVAALSDNGVEVQMPDGHDVNSLVLEQEHTFLHDLSETFAQAHGN